MITVEVLSGDITQVRADALITTINSGRGWLGGIDAAIAQCAGSSFHRQAATKELVDGQAIYATSILPHSGRFSSVLFVVDDLRQPLRNIVRTGLHAADHQGLASVTLPAIRTGMAAGQYESTEVAALNEMATAIREFITFQPRHIRRITVVIYHDPESARHLKKMLQLD